MFCLFISATNEIEKRQTVNIDLKGTGRVYEGIGALSAGASSKLLMEYHRTLSEPDSRFSVQAKIRGKPAAPESRNWRRC